MKKHSAFFTSCAYVVLLLSCTSSYTLKNPFFSFKKKQPEINVFVHGTVRPPKITISAILRVLRDEIQGTLYKEAIKIIRNDPFFYGGQAMQEPGLVPIDLKSNRTATTFAQLHNLQKDNPKQQHYYTFGWSGLLSIQHRYEDALRFYKELCEEIERFRKKGQYPKINIYTYSHGANVALNLAAVHEQEDTIKRHWFSIDKLILFGAPVQKETDFFSDHPIFHQIYHIYSPEDKVQIMDFSTPQQYLSDRIFTPREDFKLPKNMRQVCYRMTKKFRKKQKIHGQKLTPKEIFMHPELKRVHTDPQHSELWCFGWGSYWYRHFLPTYPLPIAAFAPSIIKSIEESPIKDQHIIFDHCPLLACAEILPKKKENYTPQAIDFISTELQNKFKKIAHDRRPVGYTIAQQGRKIKLAMLKARREINKDRKYLRRRDRILMAHLRPI